MVTQWNSAGEAQVDLQQREWNNAPSTSCPTARYELWAVATANIRGVQSNVRLM